MKFTIGYFYPNLLNLYGDRGNVEVLAYRSRKRGFEVDIVEVTPLTKLDETFMQQLDVIFMGGGPDSGQKLMYKDLVNNKGKFLKEFIENDGVGLFICGSYQLLGHYYKAASGDVLDGLGVFDLYTEHFGLKKPRCVGNVVCSLNDTLLKDPHFPHYVGLENSLVGFENHGGRTFLGEGVKPLANVSKGFGNNGTDSSEGLFYKNCIGTYLHGPFLARNPHVADFLIAKSLGILELDTLDDSLVLSAHTASKKLKQ